MATVLLAHAVYAIEKGNINRGVLAATSHSAEVLFASYVIPPMAPALRISLRLLSYMCPVSTTLKVTVSG